MHLAVQLTENIELGAVRVDGQESLEVVTSDGGGEVRNLRAENEARRWEVSLPTVTTSGDMTDYNAAREMWADTGRGLHTFIFRDFIEDELVRVRFDSPLQITAPAGHLRHIETFTLKEVWDVSPDNTVAPAITGILEVGETLTVSNGTWDTATGYTYQWTRDGVAIGGATANTRLLLLADEGAMMGCEVTATDADGGQTLISAAEVGPILP